MKKILLYCCLFLSCSVIAQNETKIKWGDIPPADLAMTQYVEDTSAAAVVLEDLGQIIVELEGSEVYYRYKRHRRIKILKPGGYQKANIIIPYYTRKRAAEAFTYLRGQVFSPDGEKTTIPNKDVIDNLITEERSEKRFAFPQVQPGSVLEYRYEIISPRITDLRDWYFQEDIPVRLSELKLEIPSAFKYIYLFQGNQQLSQYGVDERSLDIRGNTITKIKDNVYRMVNVPALKQESYLTTLNDYRARMRFQLKEIQFPMGNTKSYFNSWTEASETLMERDYFGKQITDEKNFSLWINPTTSKIFDEKISEREKATKLYAYVANTVKWNKQYRFTTNEGLNNAFEQSMGSSGERNLIYLVLLRKAGITADPVLVSTRSHGRPIRNYPIMDQFNHLMISAELDGETTLLEMGDLVKPMDHPNLNSLNYFGWLMDENVPHWIDIEPPTTVATTLATIKIDEAGQLFGKLQGKYKGYIATAIRREWTEEKNIASAPEIWKRKIPGLEVDSVFVKNQNAYDKSLHVLADVRLNNVGKSEGDLLYFNPVLISDFHENTLPSETRIYPVDFNFPLKEAYVLNMKIPAGYSIESLPESISLELPDNSASYHFLVSSQDKFIQLISKININKTKFPVATYASLRELFIQIESKLQEPIVLKKIEKTN